MTTTSDFLFLCLGVTYIASRTTYWIFRVLVGFLWLGFAFYENANPFSPTQNIQEIIYVALWGVAVACWFWGFWTSKQENGTETGKFKLPFMKSEAQEEQESRARYQPSRYERNSNYRDRVNRATRGER